MLTYYEYCHVNNKYSYTLGLTMNLVDNGYMNVLRTYVGKSFYNDFNEIEILSLFGECSPFFLCRMVWSDYTFCAEPLEVITMFDDNLQPFDEYNVAQLL